jgi:hypothetical protein
MGMRNFTFVTLTLVVACGGNLDVGNGPGTDSGVTGTGSCTASDCAGYAITCSSGEPTNLQCVADETIMSCTLVGQCAAANATQTCTFTPPPACTGNGPCVSSGVEIESGEIDLTSDPTTSTTTLDVNFGDEETQTIGDCQYQPYGLGEPGYVNGQPLPNEGTVTATAAGFTLSASPLCDGTYPTASTGQLVDLGAIVSFDWVGTAGSPPPTFPSIPGPHAISVTEPGTLNASATTLMRASDVALSWTPLETPLSLEQVGFELVQGSQRLECRFTASANTGTVPADALLEFTAGTAQFRMFSLHASLPSGTDDTTPTFIVMRQAVFSDGPAVKGTLTLQ